MPCTWRCAQGTMWRHPKFHSWIFTIWTTCLSLYIRWECQLVVQIMSCPKHHSHVPTPTNCVFIWFWSTLDTKWGWQHFPVQICHCLWKIHKLRVTSGNVSIISEEAWAVQSIFSSEFLPDYFALKVQCSWCAQTWAAATWVSSAPKLEGSNF